MLVESTAVRDLLNTSVVEADNTLQEQEQEQLVQHSVSLNPIPALVILLLGIMMSSHTQTNMVSSMVHKQWGTLLTGASLARALTYVLMYLRPPRSVLPSRPPTELLAAFGLCAGGIIFMASSGDTIAAMINQELDAMFMYTVTMGLVALLMAWVVIVMAIKGWAVRRELRRPAGSYGSSV
ncbi:integral membrane protein [Magnaporthiopsis poae ATCC 64411]|uniref:Integral membrane protein n=1 Tax=Magnaporthiopsis poae (strain ATCC 64411 / 73-15) TaxID=644358 RepID=A0A0C4DUB7_MAGP6|nr:integral membrane protein [Magnaporthiopsis poae ATCC 64411]